MFQILHGNPRLEATSQITLESSLAPSVPQSSPTLGQPQDLSTCSPSLLPRKGGLDRNPHWELRDHFALT